MNECKHCFTFSPNGAPSEDHGIFIECRQHEAQKVRIAELEARCAKMRAWIAKSEHLSMCDAHPQAYDIQGKSITNPKCTCGKDALAEGGEHG